VERSLIRIEADEVTYNLHILIRFELELEIFEGGLELTALPEAWNARYRDYLGLEVPDDAHGVLQDVHWPSGAFGYFPTYSLGNIIAGQLWEAANRDLGNLPSVAGCARTCTGTAAGSRPPRSSSAPAAASSRSSHCLGTSADVSNWQLRPRKQEMVTIPPQIAAMLSERWPR
jgi:hypothetical protein